MDQPDKTSTDDLKRMLRRLERIEAEKAERVQVRGRRQVGDQEAATSPVPPRRSTIVTAEAPDESGQTLPPKLPSEPPPAASGIANEPGLAAEIRQPRQRHSAPVIIVAIAAVMLSTMTAAVVTFWLMGGLDRDTLNPGFASKTADHSVSTGLPAVAAPATTVEPEHDLAGVDGSDNAVAPSGDLARTTGNSDAEEPETRDTEAASDDSPPASGMATAEAGADGDFAAVKPEPEPEETAPATSASEIADTQTFDDVSASEAPASPEPEPDVAAAEAAPEDLTVPSAAPAEDTGTPDISAAEPEDTDIDPAPQSSIAALQTPPDTPVADTSVRELPAPGSVKLVSPEGVVAEAGVPLPFPIAIEASSSQLNGYYVVVSGLTRGSTFSSGIALLFDTWQIPAASLKDLKLNASSRLARRMKLKVELRGPQGETVTRTALMVELPGTARSEAGLEELDASDVSQPSQAAQELVDRAEVFLDNGSLQAARMLLERAAAQGAGTAAMMLAASYDPQFAKHYSEDHPGGDPARAKQWYQRAAELGVSAAASRLKAM